MAQAQKKILPAAAPVNSAPPRMESSAKITGASLTGTAARFFEMANEILPEWQDNAKATARDFYLTATGNHPADQPQGPAGETLLARTTYDGTRAYLTTPGQVLRTLAGGVLKTAHYEQEKAAKAHMAWQQAANDAHDTHGADADGGPDGITPKLEQAAGRALDAALIAAHWTMVGSELARMVCDLGDGQEVASQIYPQVSEKGSVTTPRASQIMAKFLKR